MGVASDPGPDATNSGSATSNILPSSCSCTPKSTSSSIEADCSFSVLTGVTRELLLFKCWSISLVGNTLYMALLPATASAAATISASSFKLPCWYQIRLPFLSATSTTISSPGLRLLVYPSLSARKLFNISVS